MGCSQPIIDNKEDIMAAPKRMDDNVSPAVAAKGELQSKFDLEDDTIASLCISVVK